MRRVIGIVSLLVLSAQVHAAKHPLVPPGTWAVEYAKEYCVLSRDGLSGEPGIAFRTRPLIDEHELILLVPRTGQKGETSLKARIETAGQTSDAQWIWVKEWPAKHVKVLETSITGDTLARIVASRSVRLFGEQGIDVRLTLPAMNKPFEALKTCEEDLARRWGIDPQEVGAWAKPAKAKSDLRELFWSKDPSKYGMLQSHHVRAMLVIDESGTPTNCTIVEKSRVAWVNTSICDILMTKGQFESARDANGKPVRGKVVTPRITSVLLR